MSTSLNLHSLVAKISLIYPMAKRWLYSFNGGIFPKYHKSISLQNPIKETLIPERLILPLKQTIGQKAELIVPIGSYVKKNQLLTGPAKENKNATIVPIHAPTSGTIESVASHVVPHASGLEQLSIILKPDFKDDAIENALNVSGKAPQNPQQLKKILLNSGIIGMGGAGFPTYAKLPAEAGQINTLLINGAECEPFITCDDLLMQTHAEEIIQGAIMVANALGIPKIICGIESNKPIAIQVIQKACKGTIATVSIVETVYPMGGEKQLIQELTGIEIPVKTHALNRGLLMFNVATYAAIFKAITLGKPLTSRLVTVSGFGLKSAYNMDTLIGTPFEALAEAAKPTQTIDYPLVMGGPMMGFKVQSNQVPVVKTTNCILVNPPEPSKIQMPCIRCGECMDACPMNLLPQQMFWHSQAHEFDKVEKLNVFDCIECGCCSYVCPSSIPLVQYYRHAKSEIKALHAEQKATDLAKQRHEFKLTRIAREKLEREARLKAKKEAVKNRATPPADSEDTVKTSTDIAKKPSAAAAAAARAAAAKRAVLTKGSSGETQTQTTKPIPEARRKAIEMAQKSAAAKTGSKIEPTKDPRVSAKRAAALAAAKKQAQAKKDSATETVEQPVKTDPREAAKQAAMAAAKKRALAKKDSTIKTASAEETTEKPVKKDPREAAKQAAMAAAKKRAAERKANKQENS
ncbi:MAG: Na+-translocating ferredoxin:NAD+ oxidoreductase subunit C [Thiomicrorhabdus sp.]|nr:MAG: Na+-translocating ferredoxin:NAD+ oxidoreductase subunit C [Thiomicrorhabdus sp.]